MNGPLVVQTLRDRIPRDQGQDLLEYALLAALIAVVAVVSITTVGNTISTTFWDVIAKYQ